VLLINYDEEGGFFDHLVPPTPPQSAAQGASTVDTVNEIYPGDAGHPAAPYGLGMRVPMLVVSPWSKGGWVNSQVFDHTSIIRFLEARFANDHPGLIESNITPWRRAVAGDLTSAFDFANPHKAPPRLPGTAAYLPQILARQADYTVTRPSNQNLPHQEPGLRPARALPYDLHAHGSINPADGSFRIQFGNTGEATAVFHVRSGTAVNAPRTYTVEPDKQLQGVWQVKAAGGTQYDLSVHAPNGFYRGFKGALAGKGIAHLGVRASTDDSKRHLELAIGNLAEQRAQVRIFDRYSGEKIEFALERRESVAKHWSLSRTSGWYDLVVTVEGDAGFKYQLAGHIENGQDSISDPAMGGVKIAD
jgi:phospholipase C